MFSSIWFIRNNIHHASLPNHKMNVSYKYARSNQPVAYGYLFEVLKWDNFQNIQARVGLIVLKYVDLPFY